MHRSGARLGLVSSLQAWTWLFVVFASLPIAPSRAQEKLSAEELRTIEFGKEIFKNKAQCQYCHKWDGGGDQGYGGLALSLRKTQLTPEQLAEVIRCGRPTTGMPYHDERAYTDKRCYDYTRADLGKDMPPMATESLQKREVDAVVKFLFARVVGHGPATYDDCVDFWGKETRQCEPMKPK
jgi:mono/diheme cytochrome c family protein